jgi:hypothetical protein
MAVVGSLVSTLADIAKSGSTGPGASRVIEILNQQNEMLEDIPWMECNDGSGHKTVIRTGIPFGTWRMLYQGVQPAKTTKAQVRDTCGILEQYSEPDKALVDLAPDPGEFRMGEAKGILEGMNQQVQQALVYGNQNVVPTMFTGFSPRYNSLLAGVGTADNVIDAGGTGADNTSIWLVCWGEDYAFGLYPKGIPGGVQHEDLGRDTNQLADGSRFEVYRDHFRWGCGLCIRDWRYIVRIANIDVSDLSSDVNKLKALVSLMIQAQEKLRTAGAGKRAWYMSRNTASKLRLAILEKIGFQLSWETVAGKKVLMFDGDPVRRVEQMLNTEAPVLAA